MPGLNACFVDVGFEKDAFLHYLDLGPQFHSLPEVPQASNQRPEKALSHVESFHAARH